MKLVVIGAGGHAEVVIDILKSMPGVELVGATDENPSRSGTQVAGLRVLGTDAVLPDLLAQGVEFAFIGVGAAGDNRARARLYKKVCDIGFKVPCAVHRASVVADSVTMGPGVAVMPGAVVNSRAMIGANVIVNSGAVIEHHSIIGDHAHLAPGTTLGGNVRIGRLAHVGIGATVIEGVEVGEESIVGAGAVVIRDVPSRTVVVGVPARIIKNVDWA